LFTTNKHIKVIKYAESLPKLFAELLVVDCVVGVVDDKGVVEEFDGVVDWLESVVELFDGVVDWLDGVVVWLTCVVDWLEGVVDGPGGLGVDGSANRQSMSEGTGGFHVVLWYEESVGFVPEGDSIMSIQLNIVKVRHPLSSAMPLNTFLFPSIM
jgi:hypothetical protein